MFFRNITDVFLYSYGLIYQFCTAVFVQIYKNVKIKLTFIQQGYGIMLKVCASGFIVATILDKKKQHKGVQQ